MTKEVSSVDRSQNIENMYIDGLKHQKKDLKAERESLYKSRIEILQKSQDMAIEGVGRTLEQIEEINSSMQELITSMREHNEGLINTTNKAKESTPIPAPQSKVHKTESRSMLSKIINGIKDFCLQIRAFLFG
jgi:hypothetical protein